MQSHILQSQLWAQFKSEYGTPTVELGDIVYTKHKIPFTKNYYAYCPRVNPFKVDFEKLKVSLDENMCIAIHFDVPNVLRDSKEHKKAVDLFENHCVKSKRDEFAKGNFLLDLTKSEDEILENMYKKHRYNIRYAQRKGVTVRQGNTKQDFEIFYELYKQTADRQGYYGRSYEYLNKLWQKFHSAGSARILIAKYKKVPLSAWLLLEYKDVLYYPYGGSSEEYKNLHGSCFIGWEAIRLGKELGCDVFDMWGASENLHDKADPYHGFSIFKSKFGAQHVVYMDSYDFIVNKPLYHMFTQANSLRWKLLKLIK